MKKVGIILSLLFLGLSLTLCLHARTGLFHWADPEKVKDVIFWRNGPDSVSLNLDEASRERFLELYNDASYGGEGDGSGGTAEWGAVIVLHGGDEIRIHEFSVRPDFEVTTTSGKWFYLNSKDLRAYILNFLTNIHQQEGNTHDQKTENMDQAIGGSAVSGACGASA